MKDDIHCLEAIVQRRPGVRDVVDAVDVHFKNVKLDEENISGMTTKEIIWHKSCGTMGAIKKCPEFILWSRRSR